MNPRDLIPSSDQIKSVQSIEAQLLQRRTKGMLGALVGIGGALTQVVLAAVGKENYITNLGQFIRDLPRLQLTWGHLAAPKVIGFLAIVLGFGTYFILRRTSMLIKESKEPFQYTFWIKPFEDAGPKPAPEAPTRAADKRLYLLHHDLMERLNERIPRLSLLNEETGGAGNPRMKSHINISGHYAVRDLRSTEDWAVQVMPRIRIGPSNEPATLAHPVSYLVTDESTLTADNYNQLIERVYSSIATEVYRQIEFDVKEKMYLFPTPYMRAVAFYHEAEDFARSNTIDAYDRAIELYREAVRHFNISTIKWLSWLSIRVPVIRRLKIKSKHMQAKVRIGYAKSLIYRREISALTGRHINSLYEIRESVEHVVDDLKTLHKAFVRYRKWNRPNFLLAGFTFPKDSWFRFVFQRPLQPLFERQKHTLFDAHVVAALASYNLGAVAHAEAHLRDAAAVDPQMSERNALYLLAAAQVEADLDKGILLLRQATEVAPDFQIAQHLLAQRCQHRFRERGELVRARATRVLDEYEAVLKINPGNIAALAAQGYVLWLLDEPDPVKKKKDLDEARRRLEEGRDIKAIVRDTFVGELNYGLARVAAEEGKFNTAYDLHTLAVASDPGIGAYSTTASEWKVSSYYELISPAMLERFKKFKNKIKKYRNGREPLDKDHTTASERIRASLYSFALNDYGNACLNYFFRFGHSDRLRAATKAFEVAIKEDPDNLVAKYNLHFAYRWQSEVGDKPLKLLEEVVDKLPNWQAAVISLTQMHASGTRVKNLRKSIDSSRKAIKDQSELAAKARETSANLTARHASLKANGGGSELESSSSDRSAPTAPIIAWTSQSQQANVRSVTLAIEGTGSETRKLEREIQEENEKIEQHEKQEELSRQALKKAEEELRKLTRKTLGRVVKNTKLSALFEETEIDYAGKQVDRLLSNRKIKWERLDEHAVEALAAWAQALSSNAQDPLALRASIRLCKHLLTQFHPDNFDLSLILEELAKTRQLSLDSDEGQKSFRDVLRRAFKKLSNRWSARDAEVDEATLKVTIQRVVLNWAMADPIHFLALHWHHQYFEPDDHLEMVQRALGIVGSDKKYRRALAELYQEQMTGYLRKYLEDEKKAIEAKRSDASQVPANNKSRANNLIIKILKTLSSFLFAPAGKSQEGEEEDSKPNQIDWYQKAYREYELASAVMPDASSQYSKLASGWADFKGRGKRVQAMEVAVAALEKACQVDPSEPSCQQNLEDLKWRKAIGRHFGENALDHKPLAPTIDIGIARNLIPYVHGEANDRPEWLKNLLDEISAEILRSFGVTVPNVSFPAFNAVDGSYYIAINRVPFAWGRIGEGERLFPGAAKDLDVLGIKGIDVRDPKLGTEVVWVARKDWKTVEKAGYSLWQIPEYIVRHFESVIRANLSEFVGHSEVVDMLEMYLPGLYPELRSGSKLSEFTVVVRRLLAEGVPIVSFKVIAQEFSQRSAASVDLSTIIEGIRSSREILPTLPGNSDQYSLHRIQRELEEVISESTYRGGSHPILFMETQKYQLVTGALRNKLSSTGKRPALLVENAELRPFVWDLIRIDFPHVPVLSRRELHVSQQPVAEIGL